MATEKMDYTKRRLLKFTACGVCLGVLGLPFISSAEIKPSSGCRDSAVNSLVNSMQAIGKEYLKRYPEENSRSQLLNLLQSCVSNNNSDLSRLSQGEFNAIIKDDFDHEDVVILKGWVLARTEARFCALYVV